MTHQRRRYEVRDGNVYRDGEVMTKADLLRAGDADSPLWRWLREHGVRRPSPSGSRTGSDSRRKVEVKLRLDPEDAAMLDQLAGNEPRNAWISRAIREAAKKST